jgi:cytoskeletal protein CcmA (bactofilin family)
LSGIEQYVLPSEITADVLGNVTATGNVSAEYFLGNGALLSGIETYVLPSEITADVLGNVTATGNVSAEYFLGNGALLSGIETYVLPSEITADVLGNVTATGNVSAEYFLGNGALLTDVVSTIPDEITADVLGNVTATGNVEAAYFIGNGVYLDGTATLNSSGFIEQQNLDGYLTVPQGYVADEAARLALGAGALPIGSVVRQADDGNSYLLTATPSNVDLNWLEFEGANFPVNTVFGRNGDVLASFGDYSDDVIELTSNIGPVPAGNALVEALEYLSESVTTSITLSGNATASYFLGNGALLTGVTATIPTTVTADVLGNVTATGNVIVAGQVNVTGNVTASYFLGNGALLEGVATELPSVANIDVRGNVIGTYANVNNVIAITGNIGNTILSGGNVTVSGNIVATRGISASYFVGNGALLEGITPPARYLSAKRSSNQTIASGNWSNTNVIMNSVHESAGITYNSTTGVFTLEGGVTYRITAQLGWQAAANYFYSFRLVESVSGLQIGQLAEALPPSITSSNTPAPVLDIIVTPSTTTDYRLRTGLGITAGSGEQIRFEVGTFLTIVGLGSGFTSGLPTTGNVDIRGNVTAPGNITVAGQVNVTGNVAASFFRGNGALLTGIPTGPSVSVFFGNLATQTINTIGNTTPLYSNVVYDTSSGFSLATRAYTPGVGGYYQINASCSWGSTVAAGQMQLHLLKNGTRHKTLVQTPATGASQNYITSGSYIVALSNTDSITVSIAQTMGNTQTILSGLDTGFTATLIAK